ncbi:xanthine dehydrogenase family protein molybdopterin-binding subunit [Streptomyces himalayensis]|uniref:Xanthine dehydrogenase family protein molybdopterin-binding subunit n=1 Tax=Streptomyces himalayensis subsp. himalayensis TaxID=2756131 RepID=A0A7W0IBP7_9ACTN|nr:xanthine dehydrogenase family protein molybdopterin-binding subunit [Streptomyces himalayensis]MBA2949653.1 xanthine dehydrogenase family protein molybdopterin-binding subunit [Streptomyces himalayensis subsp. himalayensis]
MTTLETGRTVGAGLDRVDAPLKVTGDAQYPNDYSYPGMAHAALVRSTIAAGRIRSIDVTQALAAPGVLTVITHLTAPKLERGPMTLLGGSPPAPLQDDRILHYGQHIAIVVAETAEQARHAARLVRAEYEAAEAMLDLNDPRAQIVENPWGLDTERGDVDAGFAQADVVVEGTFTTPDNTNNPLGLMATIAFWHGDSLTVHDSTQWPHNVRTSLATIFKIPESGIRVLAPFVGGGFGAGLRVWPHVILTVLAAREVNRPVKLVLTRPEMFTSVGHRPNSVQQIKVGATRGGDLVAIEHHGISSVAMEDDDYEPVSFCSAVSYACPNVLTRDRQARLNIPCPGSMRAPAEGQGNFALESAIDEVAHAVGMDPLEIRLRNYAEQHPFLNLPWSSKALRECYLQGAERFGWSRRTPEPGSMRDGRWLVGYGLAGVSYPFYQVPCQARASVRRDGSAYVRSAATDIGTGTYTVMTQLAAELLGLDITRVRFDLGDSDMPYAPQAGGSGLTGALGNAVHAACRRLVREFLDVVRDDAASPLRRAALDEVTVTDGRIHRVGDPGQGESYVDILARHSLEELSADGRSTPPQAEELGMALSGAFGAKFVEVRIDPELGLLRVARVVSAIDGGRILNEKTATSQIIGGTVGGISQALFEETATDEVTGRIANATFGDYLMPVNADVPDMEVLFVGGPDRATAVGTKGVGEVGLVGIAAAIGNAVYHATGRRLRSLPITIDQLML